MSQVDIREILSTDELLLDEIGRLRIRAWATEVPEIDKNKIWLDETDKCSRHWAVFQDGKIVAGARLSIHLSPHALPESGEYDGLLPAPCPLPIGSLNRLVVAPEARGQGLSRVLDIVRMSAAEEMGCKLVVGATSSGIHRLKQLESLGFVVAGNRKQISIDSIKLTPRIGKVLFCVLPRCIDEVRGE